MSVIDRVQQRRSEALSFAEIPVEDVEALLAVARAAERWAEAHAYWAAAEGEDGGDDLADAEHDLRAAVVGLGDTEEPT